MPGAGVVSWALVALVFASAAVASAVAVAPPPPVIGAGVAPVSAPSLVGVVGASSLGDDVEAPTVSGDEFEGAFPIYLVVSFFAFVGSLPQYRPQGWAR